MEHIVQFAINIDDKTIQQRIEANAYNDIVDRLYKEAYDSLPYTSRNYYSADTHPDWIGMLGERIDRFIEENRDEIIDATAERLARSYRNSKAFKERMAESE